MTAYVDKNEKLERHSFESPQKGEVLQSQEKFEQADIQPDTGEVSEFMDGLDIPKPGEKVSEKVREDDKKQQGSGGVTSQGDDDEDVLLANVPPLEIPTQRVMVRRIRRELHREIKDLLKQAKREEKKGAFYMNEIYERIRKLRGSLTGLATATYEAVKGLYVSLFEKKRKS